MTDDPAFRPETLSTWELPDDTRSQTERRKDVTTADNLWTVDECDEQIADAQYVLDHPGEYDPSIREAARRSLGLYERYRAYAARIEELEIRDKMRDDEEHYLTSEIEARDARIAELERVVEAARACKRDSARDPGWSEMCNALAALKEQA
jgi:hypothetical protein